METSQTPTAESAEVKTPAVTPQSLASSTTAPQVEAVNVSMAPPKSSNKVFIILIALFLLILGILIGGAAIYFISLNSKQTNDNAAAGNNNNNNPTETPISYQANSLTQRVITVTSPVNGDVVNGKIEITGTATAILQELTVNVYDDSNNLLGTGVGGLASGNPNPIHNWFATINLTKSPATLTGKIKIFPSDEGESSSLVQTITVNFETITTDQVILYTPLKYQIMSGASVAFKGQMKDFFEANMLVRVLDANGAKLVEDTIVGSGDNYNHFVDFAKNISIVVSSNTTDTGSIQFIAQSPLDSREDIIVTQPIRFR